MGRWKDRVVKVGKVLQYAIWERARTYWIDGRGLPGCKVEVG